MKKNSREGFAVYIPAQERTFFCRADEHLFSSMRRAGFFKGGCCGGGCGICKVRLISGEVSLEPMSREHITPEEEAEGYILACRAKLNSDIVLALNGSRTL